MFFMHPHRTILLFSTLLFAFLSTNGQISDRIIRLQVLEEGIVDSTFVFGNWRDNDGIETHLTYLGQVTNKRGKTFKIVNSIWLFGPSPRATSRILVFNEKNQYVGNYYMTMITDLPTSLADGKLFFKSVGNDCDKGIITVINLNNGLPRQFFKKCKGELGDIFNFSPE